MDEWLDVIEVIIFSVVFGFIALAPIIGWIWGVIECKRDNRLKKTTEE